MNDHNISSNEVAARTGEQLDYTFLLPDSSEPCPPELPEHPASDVRILVPALALAFAGLGVAS